VLSHVGAEMCNAIKKQMIKPGNSWLIFGVYGPLRPNSLTDVPHQLNSPLAPVFRADRAPTDAVCVEG